MESSERDLFRKREPRAPLLRDVGPEERFRANPNQGHPIPRGYKGLAAEPWGFSTFPPFHEEFLASSCRSFPEAIDGWCRVAIRWGCPACPQDPWNSCFAVWASCVAWLLWDRFARFALYRCLPEDLPCFASQAESIAGVRSRACTCPRRKVPRRVPSWSLRGGTSCPCLQGTRCPLLLSLDDY